MSYYSRVALPLSLLALAAFTGCVKDSGYSPGSAAAGPDGFSIVSSPDLHDQYFPITSGAHAGKDCNTCHGGTDSFKEFSCWNGCHNHDQNVTDPAHVAMSDYRYESAACYSCHPRGQAQIDRASHDVYFPIKAGTKHESVDCATCHTDPTNRQVVDCIGCHDHAQAPMATQHQGIAGYQWTSQACLTCHPKAQVNFDRNSHDAIFLISSSTPHGTVDCSGCHTDPNNRQHVECTSCHDHAQAAMQTVHDGIADYAWNDASCRSCHPKGEVQFDRASHDQYFYIGAGTAHENTACSGCHTQAGNRQHVECTSCHDHAQNVTDPIHALIDGYAYQDSECRRCHPKGDVQFDRSTHAANFPIDTGSAHQTVACADCHTDPNNRNTIACINCHEHASSTMQSAHLRVGNYQYSTQYCMRCHSTTPTIRVSAHTQFRATHGGSPSRCLQCHDRMQPAPKSWAADFTDTNCSHNTAGCHGD